MVGKASESSLVASASSPVPTPATALTVPSGAIRRMRGSMRGKNDNSSPDDPR